MIDLGWQITLVTASLTGLLFGWIMDLLARKEGRFVSIYGIIIGGLSALTLAFIAIFPVHDRYHLTPRRTIYVPTIRERPIHYTNQEWQSFLKVENANRKNFDRYITKPSGKTDG